MSKYFLIALLSVITPMAASAQATIVVEPAYRRAQALVNDGNVAAGRGVVDSMIAAATPGSIEYAEGIYWRAVLAATAADAEMDYRRIVVDFSFSPRAEDALIRLAQLEIARGNYDAALRHLGRLALEHPDSPARARAGYWGARALFDKKDIQGGCAATADALSRVSESDAELKNQISYLNQRCAGVVLTTVQPAAKTVAPSSSPVGAPQVSSQATTREPISVARATADSSPSTGVVSVDSSKPAKTVESQPKAQATPRATTPAPKPTTESAASSSPATPSEKKIWSVQIAAYNAKSQAEAMVAKLKKKGYESRVDGTAAPFRVRIGKYATQGQANAVQRSLKAKQMTGFVVQADAQ